MVLNEVGVFRVTRSKVLSNACPQNIEVFLVTDFSKLIFPLSRRMMDIREETRDFAPPSKFKFQLYLLRDF